MALVLKDRVQETTTTTGTGTVTLAGAVSGFQSFSAIGNGNTCYYAIVGGTEWEVGLGTYTSSGTTLSRDTILESSNGGTAVNFSAGTKNVFVTYPAEQGIYKDASGNAIALGTPASVNLTNATGLPLSTGVTGTLPIANGGTGSTSTTYVNLASNVTGTLPVANGGTGITSLGTGVATFLGAPSSSNLASAVTDETGSGSLVFATSPTLVTPDLGTPSSGTLTSCTGLPLTTGVTGTLPVTNGGTGTATSFTTGSVVFAGASGVYSQDNANLFWDDTNNYLGIGTNAPTTKLTISNNTVLPSAGAITGTGLWQVGADATNNVILLDAFAGTPVFVGRRATGTAASPSALGSGGTITGITAHGYGTTGYSSGSRAGLTFLTSEAWTDTAQGTFMAFSTTTNGTTTNTERMRIDNAGNVGIGTTSLTQKLNVVGGRSRFQANNETYSLQLEYGSGLGQYYIGATNSLTPALVFSNAGGTERMRIDTDGNVGIGTSSPSVKLDVIGSIEASPAATQDGVILAGRAGGTSSFAVTLTPTTLTASRTITLPDSTTTMVGTDTTQTLTNKRITPRVSTTTSSATPTINTDTTDQFGLTALAVNITSFTTNLSGTPTDGQKLWIYIVGTAARTITWGASFEASTVALPTTTVSTNRLDVGFVWNAATSKWRCVAVA